MGNDDLEYLAERVRALRRAEYAARMMRENGRVVRTRMSLDGMTPEEKLQRRHEQARERMRRRRHGKGKERG